MKTIADILDIFDIIDADLPKTDDLIIDLDNDWYDGNSYQIVVNDVVREIEFSKVSKCGLVLFVDTTTKQITVVSLSHNKSSTSYRYQGKILLLSVIGRNECRVTEFEDTNTIKYRFRKSATKRKKEVLIEKEFSNSDEDRKLVKKLFNE